MTSRLRNEEGTALIAAILVTALVLTLGLSLFVFVDAQQQLDQNERQRDSSFDVAEGVLNAETFIVGRQWPTAATPAPSCASGGTAVSGCPSPGWVAASLGGADYAKTAAWNVAVYDNQRPDLGYYQEGVTNVSDVPHYDANGDGRMWIRGQGQVSGRVRTLVAQVRLQRTGDETIDIPHNLITAGSLTTGDNSQNKKIIDGKGASAAVGTIQLRCGGLPVCLHGFTGQLGGANIDYGLTATHAVTPAMVDRMRARAQAEGTYFNGTCPSAPDDGQDGSLVFIENVSCQFSGNGTANSETTPGILFSYNGTLRFTGSSTFYGLVYAYNNAGLVAPDVVYLNGTVTVQGAVIVDGSGGLTVGNSGGNNNHPANIVWDDRYVFQQGTVYTYGSAGVIQSTWRQVAAPWTS